jgi:hypothetical protein
MADNGALYVESLLERSFKYLHQRAMLIKQHAFCPVVKKLDLHHTR